MPKIIQFFHPGQEHGFDRGNPYKGLLLKNWNQSPHKRKFVLNDGCYVENGEKRDGKLLFWCEWEPPSSVKELKLQTDSEHGLNPKFLHFPFLPPDEQIKVYQEKTFQNSCQNPDCKGGCTNEGGNAQKNKIESYQNTDPFVFGDCFIYAICRQDMKSLRALEPGSLILFGSRVNLRFAIDTVLVVKDGKKCNCLQDVVDMKLGKYPDVVTRFVADQKNQLNPPDENILYRGASWDKPHQGMYSFAPAKIDNGEMSGFPRFVMPDEFYLPENKKFNKYFSKWNIENGKITEQKTQGIKATDANENEIKRFWEYLKCEISKNHVLGVKFEMPCVDNDFRYRGN